METGLTLPRPRAVIFDWDDTIVNTWPVIHQAINTTLRAFGHDEWSEEEAIRRIGPPAQDLFTGLFGADKWQEADDIYVRAYLENVGALRMYDHVAEMLEALAGGGVYLAVISSKRGHVLRNEVAYLGLEERFGRVIGAEKDAKNKPDPAVVLAALEGSGIAPGPDVWFVGDSKTDLVCAHASGCTPVLVETKPPDANTLIQYPPAMVCRDHAELKSRLVGAMRLQGRAAGPS